MTVSFGLGMQYSIFAFIGLVACLIISVLILVFVVYLFREQEYKVALVFSCLFPLMTCLTFIIAVYPLASGPRGREIIDMYYNAIFLATIISVHLFWASAVIPEKIKSRVIAEKKSPNQPSKDAKGIES
jgi:hypothetical protein